MTTRPPLFQVTTAAAERIKELIAQRHTPPVGIRIGVKARGCTGLSYTLEYVDTPNATDEIVEDKGIKIFVEPQAVLYVIGTIMDFKDEKVASGFIFQNPNEKGRCGCGESFHV